MTFKRLVVPDEKELFFVGDVHGHYDLLEKGIQELGAEDAVIVSVGDLIDRGPHNLKCLEEFTQKPDRHMVLGNHEDLMINSKTDRDQAVCWLMNGGVETLEEVGEDGVDLLISMLADVPSIMEVHHRGKVLGVVHGGIPLEYQPTGLDFVTPDWATIVAESYLANYRNKLIWDRDALDSAKAHLKNPSINKQVPSVRGVDYTIHGHSPMKSPAVFGNRVYQDVGSFYSGKLCFSWIDTNGEIDFWVTNRRRVGAV